jgi:putative ABC transport system permease protein
MEAEMRFHLDARAADLEAQGVPRLEAERRARREFGSVAQWKDAGREARGLSLVDDLSADLRYAVRTLRRAPAFTLAAVVSLALGIGANTAIFGLVDALLLKPIPVKNAHELVHVTTAGERGDANSGSSNVPWFLEVAARTDLFSDAMLVRHDVYKVGIGGRVEPITGQRVTDNYYTLLGVTPLIGRTFSAADLPERGGSPVAIISYDLWQRRFGGAATVLGRSITVDQAPYTIIGVTRPEFRGLLVGWTMDVTTLLDRAEFMDAGNWLTMPLIARLKPGVEVTQVGAQLTPQLKRLASGTTERFRRRYLDHVAVESAAHGITDLRIQFARPLRLLMGAVGLLLLIACVNLAGLLLVRNATRQHELGMRLALGAGRPRIMRQLLTESALLALLGAVPGVVLALKGSNLLLAFMPPQFGPLSMTVAADWRVIGFAIATTVATTLLFGVIPAWQGTRVSTAGIKRVNPRTTTARVHLGRTLVAAQFALSLVLIAGAALTVRTLVNLARVETGFDRSHVLVVQIDPQGTPYERDRLRAFQREMLTAFARLPGIAQATLSTSSPFNGNMNGRRLTVPGFVPRDVEDTVIQVNLVGPSYFDALSVPILHGRPIDARDQMSTARVAVVSESFARRYFGDARAAVGRQFSIGRGPSNVPHEIVGVARDVRYQDLRTPSDRLAYVPWFQDTDVRLTPFEFVIRTQRDPAQSITAVRREIERLHPGAPILAIQTMTGFMNGRLLSERLLATVGTFFAIVALMLAAVGVYGLLAHLVARRVPEIGVRLAIGARPLEMIWMTMREILILAGIGASIGIITALAGLRVLDGLLFGLSPSDPVNLVTAALILLLVALAAAAIPARRAASVDPAVALRSE